MCGISGYITLDGNPLADGKRHLNVMNHLQRHRGPDGSGIWLHRRGEVGFGHRRLSIIDLSESAAQPMTDNSGNWVVFNGEIYNYLELRQELGQHHFRTASDTEVILHAWRKWGTACVNHFRGMFAFALWDEATATLFCARDRFGIKPFYYTTVGSTFYFASEAKALLPFLPALETDLEGFKDYLAFQFCLEGKTLFKGIRELLPAHSLTVRQGRISTSRYWEVYYTLDFDHTPKYFRERIAELLEESIRMHLRSDVPVGAYVSGGLDSSSVAAQASRIATGELAGFCGRFSCGPEYDESRYARLVGQECGFPLHELEITAADFIGQIHQVVHHLDMPVAGPGSFSQYMISSLAARHRKVVLGGQGGDEIFGGYTRYLVAYFEQCIKAAIEGTMHHGNFIVTYESIIPNLVALKNYKPLLQEFWREGLFEEMDRRYFRLINRTPHLGDEIRWELLGDYSPYATFSAIFNGDNVSKKSYFDLMTHFDFKTLLPALLQVEDRVSMAHGMEARVPLLDHPLVEFAATIPADSKFRDGDMKHIFKRAVQPLLPTAVYERTDKMGFPTPLNMWIKGEARDFVIELFGSRKALGRDLVNNAAVGRMIETEPTFGRNLWGLLSLELWQCMFHDRFSDYKRLLHEDTL